MNILSLDLELNQPSNTIIQVGYVIGNLETGEILERVRSYVRVSELINPYIIQLTGITDEDIMRRGESLQDVYKRLAFLHTKHKCFRNALTWGGGDSSELRQALNLDVVEYALGRRWIDAKTLYVSRAIARKGTYQAGLAKAMGKLGLSFEGQKHDALDDAHNTFHIYRRLLEDLRIPELNPTPIK